MTDYQHNLIIGGIIGLILGMIVFCVLYFRGTFNGLGRGKNTLKDCEVLVRENYGELADDCKFDYPELAR